VSDIDLFKDIRPETVSDQVVRHLHKSQNISQANIDIIEVKGKPFVLKHFFEHPFLVRIFWGRYIIGRERRNYRILQGIKGIPKIHFRPDPYSIIMEYVDGKRLPHLREYRLSPLFFERLRILVKDIHNRGITHGDLRRKNILVAGEESPFLIDFAGAFRLKGKGNFITRAMFRRLKNVDDITVLKLQNYYLPGTLTAAETARLKNVPWYLRLGRFFKKKVYRPFKHTTRGTRKKKKTIT
jgi:serine/threonine protein kinase